MFIAKSVTTPVVFVELMQLVIKFAEVFEFGEFIPAFFFREYNIFVVLPI